MGGGEALDPANADTILDYTNGAGDKIDLQSLIPVIAMGKTAADYVQVVGNGSDLIVKVDITGDGSDFQTAYTLSGADTGDADEVGFFFGGQNWTIDDTNFVAEAVDPIILDLDGEGLSFTSLSDGAQFDINVDGVLDQVAWITSDDAFLAFDLDASGTIADGSEILSPFFGDGSYASSLEALASLDTNSDGVLDASDFDFANLSVWQDLNGDGISDTGELHSLTDLQIASISLNSSASQSYINGQTALSEGSFTYADGTTGSFVEVALDAALGTAPPDSVASATHEAVTADDSFGFTNDTTVEGSTMEEEIVAELETENASASTAEDTGSDGVIAENTDDTAIEQPIPIAGPQDDTIV